MKLLTFGTISLVVLIGVAYVAWAFGRWSAYRTSDMPDTCAEAEPLRWVEHADVQRDFRQHVESEHDMRFLSMYGLSFRSEFPGLEDTPEMQRLVQEHGSRRLEGTTDILGCIEQRQLQEQVFHYAMCYNSMMLGYRECPK